MKVAEAALGLFIHPVFSLFVEKYCLDIATILSYCFVACFGLLLCFGFHWLFILLLISA